MERTSRAASNDAPRSTSFVMASARFTVEITASAITSATASPPISPPTNASNADVSRTTLVILFFLLDFAPAILQQLVDEANAGRDELTQESLRPLHCCLGGKEMNFLLLQAHEQDVAVLQSEHSAHCFRQLYISSGSDPDFH